MDRMDRNKYSVEIEDVIDAIGVKGVLGLIEEICYEKADHIETNWQSSGQHWDSLGIRIGKMSRTIGEM